MSNILYLNQSVRDQAANARIREIMAAEPLLHERSIVVFDDTVFRQRQYFGNGELAVPWLLQNGWKVLHSGYQTICSKTGLEKENS